VAPRQRGLVARYLPDDTPEDEIALCVHRLQRAATRPERIFMQFHGGVYRSGDAGETWTDIADGLPSDFGFRLALDPRRRSRSTDSCTKASLACAYLATLVSASADVDRHRGAGGERLERRAEPAVAEHRRVHAARQLAQLLDGELGLLSSTGCGPPCRGRRRASRSSLARRRRARRRAAR